MNTHYLLDGTEAPSLTNLADLFKRFADSVKDKTPIGLGQQQSKLTDHHNNIIHEKEKE